MLASRYAAVSDSSGNIGHYQTGKHVFVPDVMSGALHTVKTQNNVRQATDQ